MACGLAALAVMFFSLLPAPATSTATPPPIPMWQPLAKGWNLVSFPAENDSFWASDISPASGIDEVATFDGASQTFSTYRVGAGSPGKDIQFVPGKGYFLNCTLDHGAFVYEGLPAGGPRSLTLSPGWNLIGWTSSSNSTAGAFSALSPHINKVARYNSSNAMYGTFIAGTSRDDRSFDLRAGNGYFVYSNATSAISINV